MLQYDLNTRLIQDCRGPIILVSALSQVECPAPEIGLEKTIDEAEVHTTQISVI